MYFHLTFSILLRCSIFFISKSQYIKEMGKNPKPIYHAFQEGQKMCEYFLGKSIVIMLSSERIFCRFEIVGN